MEHKIFGCKVNKYYLTKWMRYFEQYNILTDNTLLVATCVVTDRAKKKWIKDILVSLEQGKRIYLTGCGAFEKGDAMDRQKFFTLYPELLPHQQNIILLPEDPEGWNNPDILPKTTNTPKKAMSSLTSFTTRKFIVIQSGCDSFCSFCLTVHKRGRHRSRTQQEIIDEIKFYEQQGAKEIILTGVNLAARGASTTTAPRENRFSALLAAIIGETSVPRIRISSLGPEFLDDQFFELLSNPRFLPYFHLSIQSFSTPVLQRMRRNYDRKTLDTVLSRLHSLHRDDLNSLNIGADIIVGFPGESESDFQETFDAIKTYDITQLHAFPFSDHHIGERIPASAFPDQVSPMIKKFRSHQLNELGRELKQAFWKRHIDKSTSILLEQERKGIRTGWTSNYIPVQVTGDFQSGQIIETALTQEMIKA